MKSNGPKVVENDKNTKTLQKTFQNKENKDARKKNNKKIEEEEKNDKRKILKLNDT